MVKNDVVLSTVLMICVLLLVPFFSPCASSKNMQQGEMNQEERLAFLAMEQESWKGLA